MEDPNKLFAPQLSRRDALQAGAGAVLGSAAMLAGAGAFAELSAQAPAPVQATPLPATDPKFPMPPMWNRELRQLAPNVYAYIQGGGPGVSAAGVSNPGMIAGSDYLLAIDATQGPIPAKAFMAASKQSTGKDFGRLVNTHHHGDHVNGNQVLHPRGDSEPSLLPGRVREGRSDHSENVGQGVRRSGGHRVTEARAPKCDLQG